MFNPICTISGAVLHCQKNIPHFRDITGNVVENMILHEIFRVVSRFPRYISFYIAENRFRLGQCIVQSWALCVNCRGIVTML